MLTQNEADDLIKVLKIFQKQHRYIQIPNSKQSLQLDLQSTESQHDKFIIDVNRKGQYNLKKCTFQTRYKKTTQLLRIDIEGPAHQNPDGNDVPCPHIHIYKEGYQLKWAYPINQHIQTDTSDLVQVLIDFLQYNNVQKDNNIIIQEGGFV